jgi:hypothetical protein
MLVDGDIAGPSKISSQSYSGSKENIVNSMEMAHPSGLINTTVLQRFAGECRSQDGANPSGCQCHHHHDDSDAA